MTCEQVRPLLGAFHDGELEPGRRDAIRAHVAGCDACAQALSRHRMLGDALRAHVPRPETPAALRDWARAAVRGEAGSPAMAAPGAPRPARVARSPARWLTAALALAACVAIAVGATQQLAARDALARELVAAHVRAAVTGHVSDVISTDQHTVKPWFNGRLDFSPPVVDLADAGFPLEGGRLDYMNDRTVAVLVFRRNRHPIDVFVWPARRGAPRLAPPTRDGYQIERRVVAGMECWAVSDLNARELREFMDRYAGHFATGR
jgi:anti-sigma factor RsiW